MLIELKNSDSPKQLLAWCRYILAKKKAAIRSIVPSCHYIHLVFINCEQQIHFPNLSTSLWLRLALFSTIFQFLVVIIHIQVPQVLQYHSNKSSTTGTATFGFFTGSVKMISFPSTLYFTSEASCRNRAYFIFPL